MTTAQVLKDAMRVACNAGGELPSEVLELRAGGSAVTPARRDEMLAKIAAGEYVELEVDITAYEQEAGKRNRKSVRFRDGGLVALGRSGKSTPFLRDHEQGDVLARGGTIIASSTAKLAEGHYTIAQTLKVTTGWAVEGFLRGTIDRFSIGWNPTGDVLCSVCNKPVFTRCYHFPGDRLREELDDEGGKRLVRDRAGAVVVEWIFTEAELIETSAVSVPAVPSTQIEGIRAALSALDPEFGGVLPLEETTAMQLKTGLLAILGLAATASDDEVISAVKNQQTKLAAVEAQNAELVRLQAKATAEAAAVREQLAQAEIEDFITSGIDAGKIVPGSAFETSLRAFHKVDADGAKKLLEASPRVTQAKAARQSAGADPTPAPGTDTTIASVDEGLKAIGATPSGVRKVLRQLGSKPNATLAKFGPRALGLVTADEEG